MVSTPAVAFVGTGTTRFARSLPEQSNYGLLAEAVLRAIDDAGIERTEVDGLISTFSGDAFTLAQVLGLRPEHLCVNNENGCGSTGFAADIARWALESGRCRYVAMVCGSKESNYGRSALGSNYQARAASRRAMPQSHFEDLDQVWGATWLNQNAVIARRHMHEFGTTEEQLASVAVNNRFHASLNPDAVYREPITVDDVLSSRTISTPLTMLMCAMVNDGAAAAIMTTADRARHLRHRPVYVRGSGSAFIGYTMTKVAAGDTTGEFGMLRGVGKLAADGALASADVSRDEIQFIQMPDPFVIRQIVILEDLGFVPRGEAAAFIEAGGTRLGGRLPFNTYGGETSGTHAGIAHPALVEAIRQLQGVCGERQVPDARVGYFASVGGKNSTHSHLVLGNE